MSLGFQWLDVKEDLKKNYFSLKILSSLYQKPNFEQCYGSFSFSFLLFTIYLFLTKNSWLHWFHWF